MENPAMMRGLERTHDLKTKPHRFIRCEWTPRRSALDVLQNEIPRTNIVDLTDVRVIQARNRACFFFEPAQPIGIRGELGGQDLDRDIATEPAVPRAVHLTHPARAERSDHFVRSDRRSGGQTHL
jgi:hypothetical protein